MSNPWQIDASRLAADLGTDASAGLASDEAARRLREHGPNALREKPGDGPWILFLRQFQSLMIWVLAAAAVVSGLLREWVDAIAILGIVFLNAAIGFIQEYRAEKSLAALRKLSSPTSKAVRDGKLAVVPSADLVPGDLIELEAGDHAPADARVVACTANFAVQEASLTGESAPVSKDPAPLPRENLPLGDRANMVFMGTAAVSGRCRALVALTGMDTELGRIAGLIQAVRPDPTPLQRRLDEFGKVIVRVCFALVACVFALEWLRGGRLVEVFLTAVSLAVAAIPEGLPAVVTVALALGVQRMVRRHVLIRKLPSVETLGCATVICSDKTGTLTRNEMTVQAVYAGEAMYRVTGVGYAPTGEFRFDGKPVNAEDHPALGRGLLCGALCNGAALVREADDAWSIVGDPTEGALLTAAAKAGIDAAAAQAARPYIQEIPFDSVRKKMTVVRREPDGAQAAYVKGAPDVLLDDCRWAETAEGRVPLDKTRRAKILAVNADLADDAMRVLAVAWRPLDSGHTDFGAPVIERDLVFAGLIAMIDPPRQEAIEAVRTCQAAGIRAVMITGDHRNTAAAVARQLGLMADESRPITGEELKAMTDDELDRRVETTAVYARVAPEDKLRIVRAWRKRGQIVAMTGDGVNDAPAVKEADIGVAMGITGTDVTKEVSDIVVTDDNFASVVAAVEEGRGIYDNILKFVRYLLSCNAGEILVMFLASLFGFPPPLLPIHILWVNLVTDGLPALALGMEPVAPGVMARPPRNPAEPVVDRRGGVVLIVQGLFIAATTLAAYLLFWRFDEASLSRARTAAFVVLSCSQLFHAFNCRSGRRSLFGLGLFSNMKLVYAVAVSFALQTAVVSLALLRPVFKAQPLSWQDWALILVLSSFPLWAVELVKLGRRRRGVR
jgi:Ca2+-transporting ATPase